MGTVGTVSELVKQFKISKQDVVQSCVDSFARTDFNILVNTSEPFLADSMVRRSISSSRNLKRFSGYFEQDSLWEIAKGSSTLGDIKQITERLLHLCRISIMRFKEENPKACFFVQQVSFSQHWGYPRSSADADPSLVVPQLSHSVVQVLKLSVPSCVSLSKAAPLRASVGVSHPNWDAQVLAVPPVSVLCGSRSSPVFTQLQSNARKTVYSCKDQSLP